MTQIQAHLILRKGATPKFRRPYPVPFAVKDAVGRELDRLESEGILRKVNHSDWAAPIVLVPKKDGTMRLCGDYKSTLNPALQVDQYPLPSIPELLASVAGGKRFTTLDLTSAYHQMVLDTPSSKLVTISTHKGLYRYTRIPFGIASAPAVFQRAMDTILQGIPNVLCYLDDILVTGDTDSNHLQNLRQVLERLHHHRVHLRREKCRFFQDSVEYLGHSLSSEGVHTTNGKVQAVLDQSVNSAPSWGRSTTIPSLCQTCPPFWPLFTNSSGQGNGGTGPTPATQLSQRPRQKSQKRQCWLTTTLLCHSLWQQMLHSME